MVESWIVESRVCSGLKCIIFALRIFARTRKVGGVRGWQGDDYLIFVPILGMLCDISFSEAIAIGTGIKVDEFTPEYLVDKVRVSMKFNFMVWVAYFCYIWGLKGCMLFFFSRLTYGLSLHKLVVVTAYIVGATYIAGMLELFLHCRPFWMTWQVRPYPGPHCATGQDNFLSIGPMNFFTDFLMLCIPIPLLLTVRMPLRRKLGCALLLCSGVFVMVATALRNIFGYLAIHGRKGTINKGFVIGWATRETFVLCIVVNAPCIKPLISTEFQVLKTWTSSWRSRAGSTFNKSSASQSNNSTARKPSVSHVDPNGDESNASSFFFKVNKKRPMAKSLSAYDRSIMATHNEVDLEKVDLEKGSGMHGKDGIAVVSTVTVESTRLSPPVSPGELNRTLSSGAPGNASSSSSIERARVVPESIIIEEGEGEDPEEEVAEVRTAERVSIRSLTGSLDEVVMKNNSAGR